MPSGNRPRYTGPIPGSRDDGIWLCCVGGGGGGDGRRLERRWKGTRNAFVSPIKRTYAPAPGQCLTGASVSSVPRPISIVVLSAEKLPLTSPKFNIIIVIIRQTHNMTTIMADISKIAVCCLVCIVGLALTAPTNVKLREYSPDIYIFLS